MSQVSVTILFALCISQLANAAVDSYTLNDLKSWKDTVETTVYDLQNFNGHFDNKFHETQDIVKYIYRNRLLNEFNAALDEIVNAAQKKGNSRANQCAEAGKAKLHYLNDTSYESIETCVDNKDDKEVNHYYHLMRHATISGEEILRLFESLVEDAEASNSEELHLEKKIPGAKSAQYLLDQVSEDLAESSSKILEKVKSLSTECSKKTLENFISTALLIKQDILKCIG